MSQDPTKKPYISQALHLLYLGGSLIALLTGVVLTVFYGLRSITGPACVVIGGLGLALGILTWAEGRVK